MISALIEVTPYPPATDDIDELLAAAADMVRARDRLLASNGSAERGDASLLVELDARQAAWQIALAAARSRLGSQRAGARRVRAYATYR
ncbi:MAG TPA: hypothetical protein VGO00_21660 [Kofleriaceae bacterium]|jgi:hypothetical protein|nr:hypothetical protein [Kofleriaceae bacterium]